MKVGSANTAQVNQAVQEKSATTATAGVDKQQDTATNALQTKYLQPDKVVISLASQQKMSAEEKESEEKSISLVTEDELIENQQQTKNGKGDLEKEIRELSLEIMQLTLQVELLKSRADEESLKQSKSLEVELALKKGMLNAKLEQQLEPVV